MTDSMWIGLFVGAVVVGPLLCWVIGMANPIGWMGYPPWRVPAEAKRADRENRLYFPSDYARDQAAVRAEEPR